MIFFIHAIATLLLTAFKCSAPWTVQTVEEDEGDISNNTEILVSEPKKVGDGISAYIVYKVTIRVRISMLSVQKHAKHFTALFRVYLGEPVSDICSPASVILPTLQQKPYRSAVLDCAAVRLQLLILDGAMGLNLHTCLSMMSLGFVEATTVQK